MTTAPQTQETTGRPPSRVWSAVGVVGELLITVGVLLLLFVAYQLMWTNVTAQRAADQVATDLQDLWARSGPTVTPDASDETDETGADAPAARPEIGDAFALMYIPRLGDKVRGMPVLESAELVDLARGIGHYPTTALPGEKGNFAVAAHRATNGEPFRDIDLLRDGDRVFVETQDAWFEYTLRRDQIVRPTDTWVINPVPGDPGATPTERLITLTTCNPRWASTMRWIWWGDLTTSYDKAAGGTPPEIEAGR